MAAASNEQGYDEREHTLWRRPLWLLAISGVVGLLAATGAFASITGFPIVFSAILVMLGLIALRVPPHKHLLPRAVLTLSALAPSVVGYQLHQHRVAAQRRLAQQTIGRQVLGTRAAAMGDLLEVHTSHGEDLEEIGEFSSPATLVTFWAYWCSPCWSELTELSELYSRLRPQGLQVIAVTRFDSQDTAGRAKELERIRSYVDRSSFEMPFAIAVTPDVYDGFSVRSIPTTVLLNAEGRIVAYGVGLDAGRQVMEQATELVTSVSSR